MCRIRRSYLKYEYESDECEVYSVGFTQVSKVPQEVLTPLIALACARRQAAYVEMMFVNNKLAPTGDVDVRAYEDYVQDSHTRFVGDNDNKCVACVEQRAAPPRRHLPPHTNIGRWDHWLDQHIGFYATYLSSTNHTQCELMTLVQQARECAAFHATSVAVSHQAHCLSHAGR